jgi:hypothetical protein
MKKEILRPHSGIKNHESGLIIFLFALLLVNILFMSCKKDSSNSKYATLLEHKWNLKSTSTRTSVLGSFQGLWTTTQDAPDI